MNINTIITICARGGSKGVPTKNIKPLLGKPLIHYTLEQAKLSGITPHIVVSSDSDDILQVAGKIAGVTLLKRPSEFATDTASKLPAIRHAITEIENKLGIQFNYIIDLDPTSPLRDIEDIQNSFEIFKNSNFENLVTACPARRNPYFNLLEKKLDGSVKLAKNPKQPITNRQSAPQCFDMNASIYIWNRKTLFNLERIIGEHTGVYVMPESRSIDIDHPVDFDIVEVLMRKKT